MLQKDMQNPPVKLNDISFNLYNLEYDSIRNMNYSLYITVDCIEYNDNFILHESDSFEIGVNLLLETINDIFKSNKIRLKDKVKLVNIAEILLLNSKPINNHNVFESDISINTHILSKDMLTINIIYKDSSVSQTLNLNNNIVDISVLVKHELFKAFTKLNDTYSFSNLTDETLDSMTESVVQNIKGI